MPSPPPGDGACANLESEGVRSPRANGVRSNRTDLGRPGRVWPEQVVAIELGGKRGGVRGVSHAGQPSNVLDLSSLLPLTP